MASFFRKVAENWKLKTLAFSIAVLLWVVVSAEQVTTNWIPVPLEVRVEDPSWQAVAPEPSVVEVRFQGAGRALLDVAVSRPPLRLTIPDVSEQTGQYDINARMVQLAGQSAVSALDVRPSSVRVSFARLDSRLVRVQPRTTGTLGSEWAIVDSVTVEPAQVQVTGPAPQLAEITAVFTEPIQLTPSDTVFERVVAIDTAGLRGLQISTASVRVSGRIDQVVDRIYPNVPVDVGPGINVSPNHVTVRLRGPERTLRAITPAMLRVAVSIDQIPEQIPPEGIPAPIRVDQVRPGVEAFLDPLEVRLLPNEADEDAAAGAASVLPNPELAPSRAAMATAPLTGGG